MIVICGVIAPAIAISLRLVVGDIGALPHRHGAKIDAPAQPRRRLGVLSELVVFPAVTCS